MKTGSYCTNKVLVWCMLLAIGMIYVLSQNWLQMDTVMLQVEEYIVNNKKTVKSKIHLSHNTPNDIFNVQMKPGLMELINPAGPKFALTVNGSYLLENKTRCSSFRNLTILMMVLSSPKNFQRRSAIRETWANSSFYSSYGTVIVLFLLGIINDTDVQSGILREFTIHGDILQGSFIDSYHNLSHKSVMGFKWATDRCRNARYVIKTDDDLVLNMFRILQTDIHMLSVNRYHVHCLRESKTSIVRNKRSAWYVGSSQFKGEKIYPPFCVGQYVMILNDIVPYLYEAARQTPLFCLDDVFMYGLVMNNIPTLKYKEMNSTDLVHYSHIHYCKQQRPKCRYVYHSIRDGNKFKVVWKAIMKQYISSSVVQ